MEIIPVIDLMGGEVVHARAGRRDDYRPIESAICSCARLNSVISDLLAFYPFKTIYLADLDAIRFQMDNYSLYQQLVKDFPRVTFWLDAGIKDKSQWLRLSHLTGLMIIIGSETMQDKELLPLPRNSILSLDFSDKQFMGQEEVLAQPENWPEQVVVLNLKNVGEQAGPDSQLVTRVKALNHHSKLIYGGGIRDEDDLACLDEQEVSATLIASALHSGTLTQSTLNRYNKATAP